jgi:hypothetical protein
LETKTIEAEVELKHDFLQQNLAIHRDTIEMKRQEIDAQHQALQLQLKQQQDTMWIKFLELEHASLMSYRLAYVVFLYIDHSKQLNCFWNSMRSKNINKRL